MFALPFVVCRRRFAFLLSIAFTAATVACDGAADGPAPSPDATAEPDASAGDGGSVPNTDGGPADDDGGVFIDGCADASGLLWTSDEAVDAASELRWTWAGDTDVAVVVRPTQSAFGTERSVYAFVDDDDDDDDGTQTVHILAPTSPFTMNDEVAYDVFIDDDGRRCRLGQVRVAPLPTDRSYTFATLHDDVTSMVAAYQGVFGVTDEAVASPDPENEVEVLFALAHELLDGESPLALARVLEAEGASDVEVEFMERVMSVGAATVALGTQTNKSLASCGVDPVHITTAEQLDCWMRARETLKQTVASDGGKVVRATMGILIGVADSLAEGNAYAEMTVTAVATANFFINQLIDALEGMLPSRLTEVVFEHDPKQLCPQESGTVYDVLLYAENTGWSISVLTLVDGFLTLKGVKDVFKPAQQQQAARQVADELLNYIRDVLLNYTGILLPTAEVTQFGQRPWAVPLDDTRWFDVMTQTPGLSTNQNEYTNDGTQAADATFVVTTRPPAFLSQVVSRQGAVRIDVEGVTLHDVESKPDANVFLFTELTCLKPGDVRLSFTSNGAGTMIDGNVGLYQVPSCSMPHCSFANEIEVTIVEPTGLANPSDIADVDVRDCCTGAVPSNCTRDDRCDCPTPPPICTAEFYVKPAGGCMYPGQSRQFAVESDFGSPSDVEWQVTDANGDIVPDAVNVDGLFAAPVQPGRYYIRATSIDDADLYDEVAVNVGLDCSGWRVESNNATYIGNEVRPVTQEALHEDGTLTWRISLLTNTDIHELEYRDPPAVLPGLEPTGELVLLGHPGIAADCSGPLGVFPGRLATTRYVENAFAVQTFSEEVSVSVNAIGPDGFHVNVFGPGFDLVPNGDPENPPDPTPTGIDGYAFMEAPCIGVEGNVAHGDLLGAFTQGSVCTEVYESPSFSQGAFEVMCSGLGGACVDGGACASSQRMGRCDLRASGTSFGFPQVQHHYPGDVTIDDLRLACQAQGGVWTDG